MSDVTVVQGTNTPHTMSADCPFARVPPERRTETTDADKPQVRVVRTRRYTLGDLAKGTLNVEAFQS